MTIFGAEGAYKKYVNLLIDEERNIHEKHTLSYYVYFIFEWKFQN
jgi:hypothetical protein